MSFPVVDGLRAMELGYPGPSRSFLNDCVLNGTKRATAGLLSEYADEGEPLEHVGERMTLVDDNNQSLGVIEVTAIVHTTFAGVTWEFAEAEGEGYADLAEWRSIHLDFWARGGEVVVDETPIVCIYFDLVQHGSNPADTSGEE